MNDYSYVGGELELFRDARCWKAYFGSRLRPYIHGDVLEVGAGIGGTTRVLCRPDVRSWTCLEPDPKLAELLVRSGREQPYAVTPGVVAGDLSALEPERRFDAILYIDVLEHIADDRGELERAAGRLREGGALVVLSPAFQYLFSPFDQAVGHHRRYTRGSLAAAFPPALRRQRVFYLDSVGMLTSLVNRWFLKQGTPTPDQIRLWDRVLVRVSRLLDPLVLHSFGRSVVAVFRRDS